jgi:hypothetical protein
MNPRHLAALLGFAFVAAWIALSFGYALLCLTGAGVFYALAAVLDGDIDLGELQSRVTQRPPAPGRRSRASTVRSTRVQ